MLSQPSRRGHEAPRLACGMCGSSIGLSAHDGFSSKVGIDATKPLGGDPAMFDKATL